MPPLSVPLTAIRQPAFLYDAGGRIAEANDRAEDLAGRPLAGLTAADAVGIFHARAPDGAPIDPTGLPAARALAGEEVVDASMVVTAADGRSVHVLVTASPIRDGDAVAGALCVWQDVTERGRVEEAEARFRALMDHNPGLVFLKDEAGRYVYLNETYERRFVHAKDWYGKTDFDIWPRESAELFRAKDREVLASGCAQQFFEDSIDLDETRYVWLTSKFPFTGPLGERYVGGIGIDATALVCAEEALRETAAQLAVAEAVTDERQRLLDALEALPIAICLLTPDYGIAFANRRFRETIGDSAGRRCYETCFGLSEPCPFCESFRVLETGEPHRWEVALPNGVIIEANDLPFTDVDGTPMVLEMDRDVTEERRMEAELREANATLEERVQERTAELEDANARLQAGIAERTRAEEILRESAENLQRSNEDLQRFAYVASHDLQEPLRSIVSFSQLLERRYKGQLGEDADEYIDFIVEGGNRMQGLILDLLAFSRVNTTRQQIARTDAEDVLAEAVRSLDISLRESGVTLTHDPLPVVMADPTQLGQVFANLISNAVKFRRPDVLLQIHVGVRRADGFCEFSVSDNGIGIEPEYFDRIFVIFQRLHTKETYPGTGIGLAIVKRIIDRHGGTIRVESTPGEGATFFFALPIA